MFNNQYVQSPFVQDSYRFTENLLSYINSGTDQVEPSLLENFNKILSDAYQNGMPEARKIIHNALFLIYQTHLSYPLSAAARRQHDEVLLIIKQRAERAWLSEEFRDVRFTDVEDLNVNFPNYLIGLWKGHRAARHDLFDFLERDATREQLFLFFKSDSALNLIFFDLVAYTLIGAEQETRGTVSENLWDEIGHGDNYFTHVNLYKNLLERQDISLPENHYIDLYGVDALAGHNAFMIGAVNRCHYYKLLGVMAMTEVLDPPQYTKLVNGCIRLGLIDKDVHYYNEHITIDIKHGDDWLYNVIDVIASKYPDSRQEFYLGCLLRLQTAERYYDNLLKEIKNI
ncbi:iron-containing redox enzyme family protein [Dryocola clanedunensis]|uniref:iron-containing redox enzyme family protein n=1 Tax=Cedecea sulfonylureivorans TaxID=3051154 RepID=UPI001927E2FC|nr:iron-containing redox enzyme family protein [Cedecea sulfonylureivorans]